MSQTLKKFKEDFVLLLEAGFVSIMHEDEDSAVKFFKAAQLLDPENVMPKILESVESYATLGEIADTMRNVFGEYQIH